MQNWCESTDPVKFVHEDIAIAAYLITLWRGADEVPHKRGTAALPQKPSFVDLGCGNGLLVDILTREGFRGRGVDLNERQIWKTYSQDTRLGEC